MAKTKDTVFGIAMRNFTRYPEMPDAQELIQYGIKVEKPGFESIWAWDHILLGVEPNFPIHEALIILTAIAARTTKIKAGTGIMQMSARTPACAAMTAATLQAMSNNRFLLGVGPSGPQVSMPFGAATAASSWA